MSKKNDSSALCAQILSLKQNRQSLAETIFSERFGGLAVSGFPLRGGHTIAGKSLPGSVELVCQSKLD